MIYIFSIILCKVDWVDFLPSCFTLVQDFCGECSHRILHLRRIVSLSHGYDPLLVFCTKSTLSKKNKSLDLLDCCLLTDLSEGYIDPVDVGHRCFIWFLKGLVKGPFKQVICLKFCRFLPRRQSLKKDLVPLSFSELRRIYCPCLAPCCPFAQKC